MTIFADYARYYDLLYKDKDYEGEVRYINSLIKKHHPDASSILDLGCGTGRHAEILAKIGFQVHGVDLSLDMLAQAEKRKQKELKLSFSQGDIQNLELNKTFDIIVSMFHVMSYQTTNEELVNAFRTASKHLKKDGFLIFDCWYGPAVLTDQPVVRVKRLADDKIGITRIAEPVMYANENRVDVNYQVFVKDNISERISEIKECHHMRYLFLPEIINLLNDMNMELLTAGEWFTDKKPNYDTWNVIFVAKCKT